jgi:hypothetical protein
MILPSMHTDAENLFINSLCVYVSGSIYPTILKDCDVGPNLLLNHRTYAHSQNQLV